MVCMITGSNSLLHDHAVSSVLPVVLQLIHDVSHQVNPEPADGPCLDRGRQIGLWSFQWIERNALIFHGYGDKSRLQT